VTWPQIISFLKSNLPALGAGGVFLSALVDSSFLPMPLVTDLMVMEMSSRHPFRMPFYAGAAALGSLAGCIWIYFLARKGGQAYYEKKQGQPIGKIHAWVKRYPLTSVLLPAMAPFPVPFKPFVLAQGVFQVPFVPFVVGTLIGRGCLFFFEGFLGARYGMATKQFLLQQRWISALAILGLAGAVLLIIQLSNQRKKNQSRAD
jgi:membrane protein YqaA with SNARE-associated domain